MDMKTLRNLVLVTLCAALAFGGTFTCDSDDDDDDDGVVVTTSAIEVLATPAPAETTWGQAEFAAVRSARPRGLGVPPEHAA